MSPLVSLVITTYNREAFLGQAIASVLQQTFEDFELLVWDDGSSDRSIEIAQCYAQQDDRVRVIAAPHLGRVAALSAAIAQTTGTYLGWVDSDDWLAPTALAETVRVLADQPETGMVYTDHYETDAQGRVLRYGHRCQIPYSPRRLLVDFMTFHFRLMRRSLYQQVGGIDDSLDFVEDYDLCLKLSEITQICHIQQPLYCYRLHSGNISQQLQPEQLLRVHAILKRALVRRGMTAHYSIELDIATHQFTLTRQCRDSVRHPATRLAPLLASLPLVGVLQTGRVFAQSITPAPDGTNTIVTPTGNQFDITGGTLSGNGANLFHSFDQFGLTQGQIANFIANPQLQNILGRVVGNNPSIINGLIQVSGGNPNLYLLNPAGIVFGANASLNVPAAFTATTANALGFNCGNGGAGCDWFSATGASNFTVLNGVPNGLAFGSSSLGAIANAGNLAVNTGQTLALLGGTVVNTGQLTAPDGQILLSAVPGQTFVRLSQPGNLLSLEFQPPTAPLPTGSALTLAQLLTGGNVGNATGLTVDATGVVRLVGAGVQVPENAATTIASGTLTTAGQTGGAIAVVGRQVGLVGASLNATGTNSGGTVLIGGDVQGLGTLPTARQTFISRDSVVNASALQSGNGGRVIVWADQTTTFGGTILAQGGATSGDGGFVEVSGRETLNFRGNVSLTAANGQTGTLLLDPVNITIISGAGGVDDDQILTDGTIFATDGGAASFTISEVALEGLTAGTNVILQATNNITLENLTDNALTFAGPGGGSITFSAGGLIAMLDPNDAIVAPARDVTLTAGTLALGNITTSSFPVVSNRGGNITLTATNGSVVAGNLSGNGYTGPGGTINVTSNTGGITVGQIQARSLSGISPVAAGGGVTLQTLSNGGDITFSTIDTSGGAGFGVQAAAGSNVTLSARGLVRGTGVLPTTDTIATGGFSDGANGIVRIQHDGGPTNQPFIVGAGASVPNGTAGRINAGGTEVITANTFGFPSSPFSSPTGRINITFLNNTPTIALANPQLAAAQNQPITFTLESLGQFTQDLNDDLVFVRLFAIAPGASLRINGVDAEPGSPIPLNANLEYSPPPGFGGNLANAFTITIDDQISVSAPQAIALTVPPAPGMTIPPTPTPTPCIPSTCQPIPPVPPPLPPLPPAPVTDEVLTPPTPEADFTTEFATYLGIPQPPPISIDTQRDILRQIERETGAVPAFVYVSFVPVSLNPAQVAGLVAGADTTTPLTERDDDQLELLVITARGNVLRRRIPQATRAAVLKLADEFRQEVADPRKTRTTTYLPLAQQLHRWLVAPIQPELGVRQINNLVFLMDAGLRSLPVAALHDGQQFLVEQYSIGLMPSVSLSDTRYQDIRDSQVLTLGISESTQGQPPLPSVEVEVATLVNAIWSGRAYLNQDATVAALKAARQDRPYGIIHMATHADFLPGQFDQSFIQLWEQRLQLDQVRQLGWNDPQVQLLVLSACSTALGDREAELGFGGLAVQSGVKSAVASLWSVNDAATAALITRFYRDLQTSPIKATALQSAQVAMIRGQVTIQNGQIRGVEAIAIPLPASLTGQDVQLSHPYYWSAFTMIGSPW